MATAAVRNTSDDKAVSWSEEEGLRFSSLEDPGGDDMHHYFVGIDPDLNGSIVAIRTSAEFKPGATSTDESPSLAERWARVRAAPSCSGWDMPVAEYFLSSGRRKRRACGSVLAKVFDTLLSSAAVQGAKLAGRLHVIVERPSPVPATDGWQSSFVSAYTFGVIMGILAMHGIEPSEVLAVQWKSQMMLRGQGKDESRALAAEYFPALGDALKRKKDHGRAEGLLLAAWAAMMLDSHMAKQADALQAVLAKQAGEGSSQRRRLLRVTAEEQGRVLAALAARE